MLAMCLTILHCDAHWNSLNQNICYWRRGVMADEVTAYVNTMNNVMRFAQRTKRTTGVSLVSTEGRVYLPRPLQQFQYLVMEAAFGWNLGLWPPFSKSVQQLCALVRPLIRHSLPKCLRLSGLHRLIGQLTTFSWWSNGLRLWYANGSPNCRWKWRALSQWPKWSRKGKTWSTIRGIHNETNLHEPTKPMTKRCW